MDRLMVSSYSEYSLPVIFCGMIAGKFISRDPSCSFRVVNSPDIVLNLKVSIFESSGRSARANPDARVAWPHRLTSSVGVNHRKPYVPGVEVGVIKAVSLRLNSPAILNMRSSVRTAFNSSSTRTTAAGLPPKGVLENASTMVYENDFGLAIC